MKRFYLLVLNNHNILCLQNYHMHSSSFVDITAKRRRHQLSLHPSFPYARYILGVAGQVVLTNHYLVHIRSLPIWFAGSQPEPNWMLLSSFPMTWTSVFHSLLLMSPAFSILIEMENLQQITTRNTAVFQELSLHESASLILVLSFLPFMELFRSLLPGYSELYHYHLLWIHGPYKQIWSEV